MMATMTTNLVSAKFDDDGFMVNTENWNRKLAEEIAHADGIGYLSELHWAIIQQMRDHYMAHGSMLPPSHICHMVHRDPQCMTDLFHGVREAWRIAGLPNPGEEAKSYM
jgi:TusE/DsrC/DsvC family sulfur relay protein